MNLTVDGVAGQILYAKSDEEISLYLILGAGFNGAVIRMNNSTFEKNIDQIYGTLKSIKISEIDE